MSICIEEKSICHEGEKKEEDSKYTDAWWIMIDAEKGIRMYILLYMKMVENRANITSVVFIERINTFWKCVKFNMKCYAWINPEYNDFCFAVIMIFFSSSLPYSNHQVNLQTKNRKRKTKELEKNVNVAHMANLFFLKFRVKWRYCFRHFYIYVENSEIRKIFFFHSI